MRLATVIDLITLSGALVFTVLIGRLLGFWS